MWNLLRRFVRRFVRNNRGVSAGALAGIIIGVAVALLVTSFILPMALENIMDVNTTGWDTDVSAMWDIIPVIALLGIVLAFIGGAVYYFRGRG